MSPGLTRREDFHLRVTSLARSKLPSRRRRERRRKRNIDESVSNRPPVIAISEHRTKRVALIKTDPTSVRIEQRDGNWAWLRGVRAPLLLIISLIGHRSRIEYDSSLYSNLGVRHRYRRSDVATFTNLDYSQIDFFTNIVSLSFFFLFFFNAISLCYVC